MEKGSGFVAEHGLAAGPIYSESQARRNIFFSQIIETPVGSDFHEKHGRQTVMPLADISVFVAALGEEAVYTLFDDLDLYGLSCFHLEPIYQHLQDPQQVFQIIFNYLIYLETRRFLLN
jgi:hypothetical protein